MPKVWVGTRSAFRSTMSTKPLAHQVVPGANGAEAANANHGAIRARDSLFHWCGTADSISESPKRDEKRALLEAYFGAVAEESIAPAARFFCGRIASSDANDRVTIDKGLIADAIQDQGRLSTDAFRARYVDHGNLSDAAAEVFAGRLPSGVSITEVAGWLNDLVIATDRDGQRARLRDLFARVSALEARYLVQLLAGTLSIGVDESLIDAATLARRRPLTEGQPTAT